MNNETNKAYPGIRQSTALTFVFIVLFVLSSWAIQLGFAHGNTLLYYIVNSLRYLLVYGSIIAMALSAKRKYTPAEKLLFVKPIGTRAYLFIIIAFFCESILENELLSMLPPMPSWMVRMYENVDGSFAFTIFLFFVIAPVCEEIIFRGIILEGLLQRYHAPAAIVICSILFGSIHLNIWQFTGAFSGGILSGYVYYKTRSVLPCVWLHALNNFMAIAVLLPYAKSTGYTDIDYPSPNAMVLIISFILLIISLKALSKYLKKKAMVTPVT